MWYGSDYGYRHNTLYNIWCYIHIVGNTEVTAVKMEVAEIILRNIFVIIIITPWFVNEAGKLYI